MWGEKARWRGCYWKGNSSTRPAGGGGVVAEQPEEEDEGRGLHVSEGEEGGRPGGPADRWAGTGGEGRWKQAGERRGKGGRRGWLGQRPSGPVRLAGPKARNEWEEGFLD
jgi:hypothetical protein